MIDSESPGLAAAVHLMLLPVLASVAALVGIIAACACLKKRHTEAFDSGANLRDPDTDAESNGGQQGVSSPVSCTLEEIAVVEKRQKGKAVDEISSVPSKHMSNGRVKSQPERALPSIPTIRTEAAPRAPEEEEDDNGLYDVITNKKTTKSAEKDETPTRSIHEDHSYETVSVGDLATKSAEQPTSQEGAVDPLYEGVDDLDIPRKTYTSSEKNSPHVVTKNNHLVPNDVTAIYAQIEDKKRRPMTISSEYQSVAPPPVPLKSFENNDEAPASAPHQSPSLPPRNGSSADNRNSVDASETSLGAVGGFHVYATPGDPSPNRGNTPSRNSLVGTNEAGASGSVLASAALPCFPAPDLGNTSGRDMVEPRYSRVTARESLDNLRKRQAASSSSSSSIPHSSVPLFPSASSPGASSGPLTLATTITEDRSSHMSDVYAEITSGSGQSSARSSTYAQVGDMTDSAGSFSVRPLTPRSSAGDGRGEDDDVVDPGYSWIKTRQHTLPAPSRSQNVPTSDSGRRSPVYALVDKSKKTRHRQTVHGDALSSAMSYGSPVSVNEHMINGQYDNIRLSKPGTSKAFNVEGGATADPGYQTIGSALGFKITDDNGDTLTNEPDYERVSDLECSKVSEDDGKRLLSAELRAGSPLRHSGQRRSTGSLGKKPWSWLHQEHIYQEINEARQRPPSFTLPTNRNSGPKTNSSCDMETL